MKQHSPTFRRLGATEVRVLYKRASASGGEWTPVVKKGVATIREEEDLSKNSIAGVIAAMGAFTLALAAVSCGGQDSTSDPLIITQDIFRGLPATVEQAKREGWVKNGDCFPNQGIHYNLPGYGAINLLYTRDGDLIGFDLESRSPQAAPPWEHYPNGHAYDPTEHWMLHVYLDDPTEVCLE